MDFTATYEYDFLNYFAEEDEDFRSDDIEDIEKIERIIRESTEFV